eukprot:TRINITY_DN34830_c0_g1_i1.p1 TRINITY_DN34830_c0_g1~~TRINITY_DN34830_c0_g1_i1.p1  ORF type:complete len:446 (+),score=127.38 TRINITY_DN34830_c0_g1_i1:133-1470(+)
MPPAEPLAPSAYAAALAEPPQPHRTQDRPDAAGSAASCERFTPQGLPPPCRQCKALQGQLLDLSAETARALTLQREQQQATAYIQRQKAAVNAAAAALADDLQITEHRIEETRLARSEWETQWRQEARVWQQRYEEAKSQAAAGRLALAECEEASVQITSEVQALRRSLQEAHLDAEDARQALGATEVRVAAYAADESENVARARLEAERAEHEAEAVEGSAGILREKLRRDASRRRELQESSEREERRIADLEKELAELRQRLESGRAAARRLRSLRDEAEIRCEAEASAELERLSERRICVDRGTSPHRRTQGADELRLLVEEKKRRVAELEEERQELRLLQRQDAQRHAARLERLRAQVEVYQAGREDLRRLYRERGVAALRSGTSAEHTSLHQDKRVLATMLGSSAGGSPQTRQSSTARRPPGGKRRGTSHPASGWVVECR